MLLECTKGTNPIWEKAMLACRYCGSVGSPEYKNCLECSVYNIYMWELEMDLNKG